MGELPEEIISFVKGILPLVHELMTASGNDPKKAIAIMRKALDAERHQVDDFVNQRFGHKPHG